MKGSGACTTLFMNSSTASHGQASYPANRAGLAKRARADIRPASLGRIGLLSSPPAGRRYGDVYGSEPSEKTSPETRMGTRSPYLLVRSSSASRLMGAVEGVLLVRG